MIIPEACHINVELNLRMIFETGIVFAWSYKQTADGL